MDEQYGLPGDHYRQPMFPVIHHRIMTSASPSPAGVHQFPLVSGGGLVDSSSLMGYGGHLSFHDQTAEINGGAHVWSGVGNLNVNYGEPSNNSRWPRQETLTLLEIRSRLNSRFKDTNQKAPLWDEVSRIMAEEHGYQRSGKKCKEKFENLYKYYKKTKEGKAGRQDGKHYRFFRQLEAIYGDQSISVQSSSTLMDTQYLGRNSLLYDHQSSNLNLPNNVMNKESLSFSINSTEFETSSSENNNDDDLSAIAFKTNNTDRNKMKGKGSSASWKAKVEHFVDSQMKKVMATQESWMEKMVKNMVEREEEKLERESERRRNEAARFDREVGEFWTKEKAWVEARDTALIGALRKLRGGDQTQIELPSFPERMIGRDRISNDAKVDYSESCYNRWSEEEISSLIELRNGLEPSAYEGAIWEEIASKMACLGFVRSASECKDKWESASVYFTMTSEIKKKRKEDYYKMSGYYFDPKQEKHHHHLHHSNNNGLGLDNSSSSSNVATQMHQNNFFHLLFGEGENLWEKYGTLRLGKDKNIDQEGV